MNNLRLAAFLIFTLSALSSVRADLLYEWNFDDPENTFLSQATSSGQISANWGADFLNTATNGSGQLIVRRAPDGVGNAFIDTDSETLGQSFNNEIWVQLEIDGWNFAGKKRGETLRLGVAQSATLSLAQITLRRNDLDQVSVQGESFGRQSVSMPALPMFSSVQNDPVTFIMHINIESGLFALHYKMGEDPYLYLGDGILSPAREMKLLRLSFNGYFNASTEWFAINRIAYLSHDPMTAN